VISEGRRAAYEVLRRTFEHDAWTDRAFPAAADRRGLAGRERAQAQRLAYGSVQRRGTSDHLVRSLAGRPVAKLDRPVIAALRLGLYEILWSRSTPDHAAVSQAVELAKSATAAESGDGRRADAIAGFVNGVLRRAAREGSELLAGLDDATPEGAAIAHSYPEWLARMWWEELGADDARSLMAAMNEPAETALRVNTLLAEPDEAYDALRSAGESVERPADGPLGPPEALVVQGAIGPAAAARIDAGRLVPQARSSQAVAHLLDPKPGEQILDLCAGPGMKSTQIAARMENHGEVISVEIDSARAGQAAELCERLGVRCVTVVEADAAVADFGSGYDRVLVDPPCSDLGVLASRPDARWRKSPEQIDRLAELQAAILGRAAEAVRPGGSVVFSVCTISERENDRVIRNVPVLEAADALRVRPDRDGTDGFFIARLERARR
jgi:16S rRNA (cytosine967-C5)-methyltransferase